MRHVLLFAEVAVMGFKVFGMEVSPYSVKVRSYFRYKQIPHEWVIRSMATMDEFQKYAKLPLVPLVVTEDERGTQDSTPIIENLESDYSKNCLQIEDPSLNFLSALLEEYADEWGNKTMFHYRWAFEDNAESCAERIAEEQMAGNGTEEQIKDLKSMLKDRMVGRLYVVGSSEQTKGLIEASFIKQLELLEAHFSNGRSYLFGARPSMADFGVFAQLYEHYTDPVSQKIMDEQAVSTRDWCLRMLSPSNEGEFETWESLSETLSPLLKNEVGALYLPWAQANSKAMLASEESFSVKLNGLDFSQKPVKYSAKSFAEIKRKYSQVSHDEGLIEILKQTDCLSFLEG